LLNVRPDLRMKDIRGNVDTRLRKLDQGDFDAVILAEAGLRRLGFAERITQVLPMSIILPAVGQGALGLETRSDDAVARQAVAPLDDAPSHQAVLAERAMLAALHGGCLAPIAAYAVLRSGDRAATGARERLELTGRAISLDGVRKIEAVQSAAPEEAVQLGRQVAEAMLAQGAGELIEAARRR
jgi:hydroxymethylbilane synthase